MEKLNKESQLNESVEVAKLFINVLGLFKHSIIKTFEDTGITAPQAMVMGVLGNGEKINISDLSSKINLSSSTVSGIVDRLEKQGMVVRERSHIDRRVVYVKICSKFNEIHGNINKLIQENTENMMNKGTPQEIDKIVEGLTTLKRLLETHQK